MGAARGGPAGADGTTALTFSMVGSGAPSEPPLSCALMSTTSTAGTPFPSSVYPSSLISYQLGSERRTRQRTGRHVYPRLTPEGFGGRTWRGDEVAGRGRRQRNVLKLGVAFPSVAKVEPLQRNLVLRVPLPAHLKSQAELRFGIKCPSSLHNRLLQTGDEVVRLC